jgi:HK97 family phage major capsid protein
MTNEYEARRDALVAEAEEILSRSEGTLSEPDQVRFDELTGLIERESKLAEIVRNASMGSKYVEREADPPPASFNFNKNRMANPWDHVRDGAMTPGDIRDRALAATETIRFDTVDVAEDKTRERITNLIDRSDDPRIAAYLVAVSNPDYQTAFRKMLRHPANAGAMLTEAERAAFAQTQQPLIRAMSEAGTGAYLVPFALDPSIILTNSGSRNPFRQISRVETIASNTWHGVSSAGVTAEWTSEASEFTDASPTFVQPTIPTYKGDAWLQASFELAGDSNIDSQVAGLMADAKDRLEAAAFATGSGSSQPTGVVTKLSVTTASKISATTNGSFGSPDIYAVDNGLPARARDRASWLAHWSVYNSARQFATASNTNSAFWVDLGPGLPSTLLGHPTYESSSMHTSTLSAATASSDYLMVLGDFSQDFVIVDRLGTQVVFNNMVLGSNRRPSGEVGWACYFRSGSDCVSPEQFVMLVV